MPRYLCVQRSLKSDKNSNSTSDNNPNSSPSEKPSPAQMQEMYTAFGKWQAQFKDNLVDMGGRLGKGKLVTSPADADGPFVEVKELVGGYMIVEAEDLDQAIEVASGCPGLVRPGSGVEVIEIFVP